MTDIIDCKISLENPANFRERRMLNFSKKYWNMIEQNFVKLVKKLNESKSKSVLDQYKDEILQFLMTYKSFTAAQVYDCLKEQHINFNLCGSSVRNYVAKLREKHNLK